MVLTLLAVGFSNLARADDAGLVEARRRFLSQSLRAPGNRQTSQQAAQKLGEVRGEARKAAYQAALKNVGAEQRKLAKGTFDRLKRFFTGSKLLSAGWFSLRDSGEASAVKGSFGAGTSGGSAGRKGESPSSASSSRPEKGLQYNGPKILDFSEGR